MTQFFVALLALAGAMLIARLVPDRVVSNLDATRLLAGRGAPWVVGVLTTLLCGYVWGHLHPSAVVHDEASYLLQAKIFARGAFSMPARPLPEFFEQFHAYVTPAFASKYPPGHALLMAPGVLLGWPSLVPLLLDGLAGALVFLLARRIANPWVGLLTWLVWITPRATFHHIASFFSQSTSGALWLLGWWALLEWRDSGKRRWLVALGGCVAWLAITRPLTALAFALPVGIVALVLVARRRAWRDFAWAAVLGVAILSLIPYANARTTGDWRVMPYSQYSQIYFPFDAPGFGLDSTPPRRELPPDMVQFGSVFRPVHAEYVQSELGDALVQRLYQAALDVWRGPRMVLAIAALAALPLIGVEAGFALASTLTLAVFYLSFAHSPYWTIYYSETLPVLAFVSALGIWRLVAGGARVVRRGGLGGTTPAQAFALSLLVYLAMPFAAENWRIWREDRVVEQRYQRHFESDVARIPESHAIVFVRYAPWHNLHTSLIANDPDLASSRAWIVYDRGADNDRLRRIAPERAAYIYDEAEHAMLRYPPLQPTSRTGS
jgi:hypothetical protein